MLLVVDDPARLAGPPPDLLLRADDRGPRLRLDVPRVLGRGPQATPLLDPLRDERASGLHCRVAPRLNQVVVEDLGSANGTWLDGRPVHAAVLRPGATLSLGGKDAGRPGVARLTVEAARRPRTAALLGASRDPLVAADPGDAVRARLDVTLGGQSGRLFLFAGPRLRFGRNRARDGAARENDLLLRAFPRHAREAASLVQGRTRNVSGHHGALILTRDGVAVRDASTLGTTLDGRRLTKGEVTPLPEAFVLEVADAVGLRGRVYRADVDLDDHPVAAVRLERTRDGEHHTYVWVVREVSVGSGPDDAICLPAETGLLPGHARLVARDGRFFLTPTREDAQVEVQGFGPAGAGVQVALEDGVEVRLGALALAFASVTDDDLLPPRG
ncbi:MAG: FHA domain-containing protein [Planctomycetes bacterium]|nr:FHA domain-containing protein [Planctomycetota bacterium]